MSFDSEAKYWDDNPKRNERARTAAESIKKYLDKTNKPDALDFGCGTGQLSVYLYDSLNNITLLDSSAGMIDVLKEKIRKNGYTRMNPVCMELTDPAQLEGEFDLVYTLMVLHHVRNCQELLKIFYMKMRKNGRLVIIDLIREDGSFHAGRPDFTGHNGFDTGILAQDLQNIGFKNTECSIIYKNERIINDEVRIYPVFMLSAQK